MEKQIVMDIDTQESDHVIFFIAKQGYYATIGHTSSTTTEPSSFNGLNDVISYDTIAIKTITIEDCWEYNEDCERGDKATQCIKEALEIKLNEV